MGQALRSREAHVKVTLSVLGDATSATGGVLLEDTDLLEALEDLALNAVVDEGVGMSFVALPVYEGS